MVRKILLSLVVFLSLAFSASAQRKQVSGSVSDVNGNPIVGAAVIVEGTSVGTTSDSDGAFAIAVPDNGTITVSYIGYESQSLPVAGRTSFKIILDEDTTMLDEVIVTAMGISRSEKSLGYSATSISSDEASAARNTNVMNNLQGKVAGLTIKATSSTPGASSSVVIRGFSSISGDNQPLYVVDGVPLQNTNVSTSYNSIGLGGISNVSSDNIETMTVLKGAAATALYGSRAANGVILITTKDGKKDGGKNFSIQYNGGLQLREVSYFPEMQNDFGQGWNGAYTYIENGSWGPALDGTDQIYGPIWNNSQLIREFSAVEDNVKEFFEIGVSQNHSVSLSGISGDETMTYFMSYANSNENGTMPGDSDTYKRNTLNFKGTFKPVDWIKISSTVNVATSETNVAPYWIVSDLYQLPRDVSIIDMQDLSSAFNTPEAYFTPYGVTNPYWDLENSINESNSKQIFGKVQLDINPIEKLTLSYRYGFDYTDYDRKYGYPQIDEDDALINEDYGYAPSNMNQTGYVGAYYYRKYEINHDFLANYNDAFGDFDFGATAGVNINERASTYLYGTASDLTINSGFWDLSNGSTLDTGETQSMRRLIGAFADMNLSYKDFLFLGVTARNDWSSTLPAGNNSFFYPGVTLSYLFTENMPSNDILSFGKVRLAYGMTGNDASAYQTETTFSQASAANVSFPLSSVNAFMSSTTAGSTELRPEITTEFEAGVNFQFFNGRIGIDASYYDRSTDDQIMSLPADPSTGYSYVVTNFGTVRNHGVELLLNTTPVQTKNFRWDLDFTFTKNKNMVVSLPESLEDGKVSIYSYSSVYMYAVEGSPMGQFYTYMPTYVEDESSPYYGSQIVDSNGFPSLTSDIVDTGFNMNPDWSGGITTRFTAYNFTLSATLDATIGGKMFSYTKEIMQFTGNGAHTVYNNRDPFIIPNSVQSDGNGGYVENTAYIKQSDGSYQDYYDIYGNGDGYLSYLVDRSYAKIRNISLGYNVPVKYAKQLGLSDINVSVFVNNPFLWTATDNTFIDPESSSFGNDLSGQFGEVYVNPSSRIYGFNLGVKF